MGATMKVVIINFSENRRKSIGNRFRHERRGPHFVLKLRHYPVSGRVVFLGSFCKFLVGEDL